MIIYSIILICNLINMTKTTSRFKTVLCIVLLLLFDAFAICINDPIDINMNKMNNNDHVKLPKDVEWVKPPVSAEDYEFEPHQFIRAHCKNGGSGYDENDGNVQIWDVAFEPGRSDVVATCGGRYLCVIKLDTGELLLKYSHKDRNQDLFALSWSTLDCGNILASGSNLGEIRLYDMTREVSFHHWNYKEKEKVAVNAVQFHSGQPSWVLTGGGDSKVTLWDIGRPAPPLYTGTRHAPLLQLDSEGGDLYSLAWVPDTSWLMVGCVHGLMGWRICQEEKFPRRTPKRIEFAFPSEQVGHYEYPYVDSVASLGHNLVATKCVSRGRILVFRPPGAATQPPARLEVEVLVVLPWRKTDNFYMNIGGLAELGLVACGDDRGNVWVYSLPAQLLADNNNPDADTGPVCMSPLGIVPWPKMEEGSRVEGDTMLDKVAFSPDGKFIVAVTNNNLVAIWKKLIK